MSILKIFTFVGILKINKQTLITLMAKIKLEYSWFRWVQAHTNIAK